MKRVLVSGMGPGGLSTAIMLLEINIDPELEVCIIDTRDTFSREQKIYIPSEDMQCCFNLAQLKKYGISYDFRETNLDPEFVLVNHPQSKAALPQIAQLTLEFLETLAANHQIISICELQKYQFNILKALEDPRCTIIQNTKIESIQIDGNKSIAHMVNVKDDETINYSFDKLVIADGASSKTLAIAEQYFITKTEVLKLPATVNNAYGYAVFKVKDFNFDDKEAIYTIRNQKLAMVLHDNLSQDFENGILPLIYIHLDKEKQQIYSTGEIPKRILDKKNDASKIQNTEWFKNILMKMFGDECYQLVSLDSGTFTQDPKSLTKSKFDMENGAECLVIGDALLPANFLFGHGVHKAMEDGLVLAEYLSLKFLRTKTLINMYGDNIDFSKYCLFEENVSIPNGAEITFKDGYKIIGPSFIRAGTAIATSSFNDASVALKRMALDHILEYMILHAETEHLRNKQCLTPNQQPFEDFDHYQDKELIGIIDNLLSSAAFE